MYIYLIFLLSASFLFAMWSILRKYTRIWINRPLSVQESIIAGLAAWFLIFSIASWFWGCFLLFTDFLSTKNFENIVAITIALMVTGYFIDFYIRSGDILNLDETKEYIKEAIQFRCSTQRRIDILDLLKKKRENAKSVINDKTNLQRIKLEARLVKEKELSRQLAALKEGKILDLTDELKQRIITKAHEFFKNIVEIKIDGKKKRMLIYLNFTEYDQLYFQDENNTLKFNRLAYDFLQAINTDIWFKPYNHFYESYLIICRNKVVNTDNLIVFYPFIKIATSVEQLRKFEGSYFNPRKFGDIGNIVFNNGSKV